jgi:imidazolonepropionase-like amidohydrolase
VPGEEAQIALHDELAVVSTTAELTTLRGLRVVDVVHGRVLTRSLTIAGGRIAYLDGPDAPTVIDLDGCWAVPSFIDMHAHVTFDGRSHNGAVPFSFDDAPVMGAVRAVQNLSEALRIGIGVVRDVGGTRSHLRAVNELAHDGAAILPTLVSSGEPLCRPAGHGSVFGQHLTEANTIDRIVSEHRADGHQWIKVMNGPELWPEDDLAMIVKRARDAGLRTAIHAFTPDGIASAVRCGADTIEHGLVADPGLQAIARDQGTQFVPTAYCSWLSLRPRFIRTQEAHEVRHLEYWYEYLSECRPGHLAAGLPMLPGTDAGCAPCTFDDYVEELKAFAGWGLTMMQVLQAATLRSATCLGMERSVGSLEAGKWANLIVTAGDPLASLDNLRAPLVVFFKGMAVVNNLGERWP